MKKSAKVLRRGKVLAITYRCLGKMLIGVPLFLAVLSVPLLFLLLTGNLENGLIGVTVLVAGICTGVLLKKIHPEKVKMPGSMTEKGLVGILAFLFCTIWGTINIFYSSQNIFIYRDPGIYSVTAAALVDESDLEIHKPDITKLDKSLVSVSNGFGNDIENSNQLFAQGQHLLPALIGVGGRLVGEKVMLAMNALFGAVSIIAVYGFARMLVKPRWAFLSTLALALSLPMIYFSRDTYTEPLKIIFIFGSLSLVWIGYKQSFANRATWLAAGLTLGAATMARPDGYLAILASVIFLSIYLMRSEGETRLNAVKSTVAFYSACAIPAILGWLDLTKLSSGHYVNVGVQIRQQFWLIAIAFFIGLLLIVLAWFTNIFAFLKSERAKKMCSMAAVVIAVSAALILASRPFWLVDQKDTPSSFVAGLQGAAGQPIDPYRTYAEETVYWLVWYLGPVALILGLLGFAVTIDKIIRKDKLEILPLVVVVGISAALFLNRVGIAPDQIWASRRLLPVIMPGITIFAAVGIQSLSLSAPVRKMNTKVKTSLFVLAASILLIPPALISAPFARAATYRGQYQQIISVCESIPEKTTIIWLGSSYKTGLQTVRSFCDLEAVGLPNPTRGQLEIITENVKKVSDKKVYFLSTDEDEFSSVGVVTKDKFRTDFLTLQGTLSKPPASTTINTRTIYIGEIPQQ